MSPRVLLRAGALIAALLGLVVGLTVYFSSEKTPPCLVGGATKWTPPTDKQVHHFELVVPDRALCFFDMDNDQQLVGDVPLQPIRGVTVIASRASGRVVLRYGDGKGAEVDLASGRIRLGVPPPPPLSDDVTVRDFAHSVTYSTRPGFFGLEASSKGRTLKLRFPGFAWNPRFGPNPPDHGLSLAPDKPELWVLDAPNRVLHVFDTRGFPPRGIADIRLTKPLSGDERPCATRRCSRIGSLQHSADGRFVYVGDVGDVIDTVRREEIANLEALHQSRLMLEVDWVNGQPEFPR